MQPELLQAAGQAAALRNRYIGFIFQTFNLLPVYTVYENVEFPLLLLKIPAAERRERVMRALERVGLADRSQSRPNQLSGGQCQRVAISRAIVKEPAVVLADEQTAGKGRSGRTWFSPCTLGVWASVLIEPDTDATRLAPLSIAAAVSLAEALEESGAEILLVPNGSPYWMGKQAIRYGVAEARVAETKRPLVYLNQFGGQDELVFDGASFVLNADETCAVQLPAWEDAAVVTDWTREAGGWRCAQGEIAAIAANKPTSAGGGRSPPPSTAACSVK